MPTDGELKFTPGIELSRSFWEEIARPLLIAQLHDERWAAALIGWGSEVLGFDTVRSTDHSWGPKLYVFLDEDILSPRSARGSLNPSALIQEMKSLSGTG